MSELFMECEEEELEPWQIQVPKINLVDDDDDEPIFIGELNSSKSTSNLSQSMYWTIVYVRDNARRVVQHRLIIMDEGFHKQSSYRP